MITSIILVYLLGIVACAVFLAFDLQDYLKTQGQLYTFEQCMATILSDPDPMFLLSWVALIMLIKDRENGD